MSITSNSQEFDYIVVGGGTAGLVVASRLTEDPSVTVCVLEAGKGIAGNTDFMIPGMSFKTLHDPTVDWGLNSVPQTGANDRRIHLNRGKVLGGSSSTNFMMLGRGHAQEYDAFETLGASGWNWKNLLQYFKKSETFTVTDEDAKEFGIKFNNEFHGNDGPLQRIPPRWAPPINNRWIDAMAIVGVPYNPDCANGDNAGVWASSHAIDPKEAVRSSSVTAYYDPNKSKSNLVLLGEALTTRILFKRDVSGQLVAQGVEYIKGTQTATAAARKEVLICAGAFQTPKLLELSGIGDKAVLEANGVTTLVDLPGVGSNYQDHFWCPFTAEMDSSYESVELLADPVRAEAEFKLYQETGKGMLAIAGSAYMAFLPTGSFMDEEVIKTSSSETIKNVGTGKNALSIQQDWFVGNKVPHLEMAPFPGFMPATEKKPEPGKHYFSFLLALLHPFSRGSVHIISSDPAVPPSIDPRILNNKADVSLLVEAVKYARKVVRTKGLDTCVQTEVVPGPEAQSDLEIEAFVRKTIQTVYHPVGTASMLPREAGGVVDAHLKVYGTTNVRVIDASILPIQISAHPQATVYAIAEKAADLIKEKTS